MKAKTHVLAGAVTGYLIFPTWVGVVAGAAGSIIPDIDEPKSYIGRLFLPVSLLLKWTIKHRTLAHSLLFVLSIFLGSLMLFSPLTLSFFLKSEMSITPLTFSFLISLSAAAGVLSHIVGDMLTGRVLLFWPLKKKIGIKVPLWLYFIIDFVCRFGLILFIFYYLFFKRSLNFSSFFLFDF